MITIVKAILAQKRRKFILLDDAFKANFYLFTALIFLWNVAIIGSKF